MYSTLVNNYIFLVFVMAGLYITFQEWNKIWADGTALGLGRLLVANLPLILLINLYILGEI